MTAGLDPESPAATTGGASAPPVRPADEGAYWLRREQAARALAEQAADHHIARIHLAMAERYGALAKSAD